MPAESDPEIPSSRQEQPITHVPCYGAKCLCPTTKAVLTMRTQSQMAGDPDFLRRSVLREIEDSTDPGHPEEPVYVEILQGELPSRDDIIDEDSSLPPSPPLISSGSKVLPVRFQNVERSVQQGRRPSSDWFEPAAQQIQSRRRFMSWPAIRLPSGRPYQGPRRLSELCQLRTTRLSECTVPPISLDEVVPEMLKCSS